MKLPFADRLDILYRIVLCFVFDLELHLKRLLSTCYVYLFGTKTLFSFTKLKKKRQS